MARFRNKKTGVVVSVSDEKADRFADGAWERHDGGPEPKTKSKTAADPKPKPDTANAGHAAKKVTELRAEIARRNKGRDADAQLSSEGNKPELVAVLDADDAAAAASASAPDPSAEPDPSQ